MCWLTSTKICIPPFPDDEDREAFNLPELVEKMLDKKILGDKTGGGFYKKSKDAEGNRVILELDLRNARIQAAGENKICIA